MKESAALPTRGLGLAALAGGIEQRADAVEQARALLLAAGSAVDVVNRSDKIAHVLLGRITKRLADAQLSAGGAEQRAQPAVLTRGPISFLGEALRDFNRCLARTSGNGITVRLITIVLSAASRTNLT